MATIKCYSGGKLIKTFKNVKEECISISAIGDYSGFQIYGKEDYEDIKFEWRGDFLIEW